MKTFKVLIFIFITILASASAKEPSEKQKKMNNKIVSSRGNVNVVEEEGKFIAYKKKNLVEFDGSLIEGEVRNPSEFYFVHRPQEKFDSLVKPRPNFHKEMLRDTVMIK